MRRRRWVDRDRHRGGGGETTTRSRPSIDIDLLSAKKKINNDDDEVVASSGGENKFSFFQRIESIKAAAMGAISGSILSAPVLALHDLPNYGIASWEFDVDMSALQGALFAIVYRYCVRENDDNDMLSTGVVGAFVLVRMTSRVRVPGYCTSLPLNCGDPLGYLDDEMVRQLLLGGMEGAALFGGAALAMEYAYGRKWITKFPN